MTSQEPQVLVIRDGEDAYYAIPAEALEQYRVPQARVPSLEQALGIDEVSGYGMDGINRLVAVTQIKSSNANDDAMRGAQQQRSLIGQKKQLRQVRAAFASFVWP